MLKFHNQDYRRKPISLLDCNYQFEILLRSKSELVMTRSASKRFLTRFKPDPLTVAYVDFSKAKNFSPTNVAVVINESYSGCAIVMVSNNPINTGDKIKIKVGQLGEMKASIVWVKLLEENIFKIGVQMLE